MNVEISPKEYWKRMPQLEGILYCQLLDIDGKNDWRMIKNSEERSNITNNYKIDNVLVLYNETLWTSSFESRGLINDFFVIPVRDI